MKKNKNNLENKKKNILKLNYLFNKYKTFISLDINNIKSYEISIFRKDIKLYNIYVLFIKKKIFLKFLEFNNFINKKDDLYFKNQTIIIFFKKEDIINIIKFINIFIEKFNVMINFIFLNNNFYIKNTEIKFFRNLLSKKKSLLKLIFILKYLSIIKFNLILYKIKNLKNRG